MAIFILKFNLNRSWKLRWQQVANSNDLNAINFDPKKRPRRQDWPGELIETGMFYLMRKNLVDMGTLQNDRYQMHHIYRFY